DSSTEVALMPRGTYFSCFAKRSKQEKAPRYICTDSVGLISRGFKTPAQRARNNLDVLLAKHF
ncbi:MAG: hypothetical protein ACRC6G_09755, partial [Deefgea sp.]